MDCPWLYALSTSNGWFLFFVLWLKGGLIFTAFNLFSSISQALTMYHCHIEESFFSLWFYNTLNHWNMKKSQLQECSASKVLATITPTIPISGDYHPPECHRPSSVLFFFDVLFSKSWWRKGYWLLTQLWLLHRSTALWEEEGVAKVSSHIWGSEKLRWPFIVVQSRQWVNGTWCRLPWEGGMTLSEAAVFS